MKRSSTIALAQIALTFVILIATYAQADSLAPSASDIDRSVSTALRALYSQNEAARTLGAKAKGVLIFPDIRKAAFIVGAQYGYGALRRGHKTLGYYRTGAASYGFQAGVKKFGYALFFMTPSALSYLDQSGGWASAPDQA
jgi:lipid-binding SYLF domain-containing protein